MGPKKKATTTTAPKKAGGPSDAALNLEETAPVTVVAQEKSLAGVAAPVVALLPVVS